MTFYDILFSALNGWSSKLTHYGNLFADFVGGIAKLLAKFLKIKGNTIVWNQLVSSSDYVQDYSTYADGVFRVHYTAPNAQSRYIVKPISLTAGHTYLFMYNPTTVVSGKVPSFRFYELGVDYFGVHFSGQNPYSIVKTITGTSVALYHTGVTANQEYDIYFNYNIVDLTLLNDSRVTDYDSFRQYYPLPYYQYEQGKLLSFNGEGIKTTGKNQFNKAVTTNLYADGSYQLINNVNFVSVYIPLFHNTTYTYKQTNTGVFTRFSLCNSITSNAPIVRPTTKAVGYLTTTEFTFDSANYNYLICSIYRGDQDTKTFDEIADSCQLEFGSTATTYEPYITSTLDIPTSTYFPNGMNGIGNDYDELTPSKAITRMLRIDLGTLNWTRYVFSGVPVFYANVENRKVLADIVCAEYVCINSQTTAASLEDKQASGHINGAYLYIRNDSYADATSFKSAMSGVYLITSLATPTETDITPPLNLSYQVWEGGTEQLLPVNTDVPTTSPILADIKYPDGERYDQYFTYRQYLPNNQLLGMALNTLMGKNVPFNQEALDILMKGE